VAVGVAEWQPRMVRIIVELELEFEFEKVEFTELKHRDVLNIIQN